MEWITNLFSNNGGEQGPQDSQNEDNSNYYPSLDNISTDYQEGYQAPFYPNDPSFHPTQLLYYPNQDPTYPYQGPTYAYPTQNDATELVVHGYEEETERQHQTPQKTQILDQNVEYGWAPLHTAPQFSTPTSQKPYTSEDFKSHFEKGETWATKDKAVEWAKEMAKSLNFYLIKVRSRSGAKGHRPSVWLKCENSGKHTPSPLSKGIVIRPSKKTDCKFEVQLIEYPAGTWNLVVNNGCHNHAIGKDLKGHRLAGRPTEAEYEDIRGMYEANIQPLHIRTKLNNTPGNLTRQKTVYNSIQKLKREGMQARTVEQEFFHKCKEEGYFLEYNVDRRTNNLTDLFFAHPDSIRLLRAFPYILIMDCTYATNMYDSPFLAIISVTSTKLNYNVAGAFLASEKRGSYTWAMNQLAQLYEKVDKTPECIVTDRELALMGACSTVFPNANQILCRRHVRKNIEDHVRKETGDSNVLKYYISDIHGLFNSEDEREYTSRVTSLEQTWNNKLPKTMDYVRKSWLIPYKEKIISAWTDRFFNLPKSTSSSDK